MIEAGRRGATTIADRAVRRIAERAAQEAMQQGKVEVIHASAAVEGERAHLSLGVSLPYPAAWEELGARVQGHVCARTAELTGLTVPQARIRIGALAEDSRTASPGSLPDGTEPLVPESSPTSGSSAPLPVERAGAHQAGRSRRVWSGRQVPTALLTLVTALGCAALLVDVVSVHLAGRAPAAWRTEVVDWLSGHGPGDTVVVAGGGVMAAVGLWLWVLAFTPGHRALLPVVPVERPTRVTLTRAAVAALVRDAVAGVPGISRARVTCGRRRVRVRTRLSFGERDTARLAVRSAAHEALAGCTLARPPRLRVTVRPEPHWRPSADRDTDRATGPATMRTSPDTERQVGAGVPDGGPSGAPGGASAPDTARPTEQRGSGAGAESEEPAFGHPAESEAADTADRGNVGDTADRGDTADAAHAAHAAHAADASDAAVRSDEPDEDEGGVVRDPST